MATTTKLVELFNADATVAAAATTTAFVELAYENLLGLSGDFSNKDERVGYWVGKINSGVVSKADFAATFLAAAAVQGDLLTNAEFAANTETLKAIAELDEATLTTLADVQAALETAGVVTPDTTGQTFTLTTSVDTLTGTANDDVFNASNTATSAVLGGLDSIDGGAGNDTLNITDTSVAATAGFALPTGMTVNNVETFNITANGSVGVAATAFDVSGMTGLTTFNATAAGDGTTTSNIKAAGTTDVALTVSAGATTVNGGKTVSVTGGAGTTVTDAAGATGTTLTSVSLTNVGTAGSLTSTLTGNGLTSVTLSGVAATANTVTVTNATANHSLTINAAGTGYTTTAATIAAATVVNDTVATSLTVNTTAKSAVDASGSTAVKSVALTGAGALDLVAMGATTTSIDGSAATGNLTLNTLNNAVTSVKTGSGNDSMTVNTAKKTVDTGAGNDTLTLNGALAAGSTVNLGAGNDTLLGTTAVAASTATATTVIDGGEGTDSVSSALINAGNAAQFVNFENVSLQGNTLDLNLLTGSSITGLSIDVAATTILQNATQAQTLTVNASGTSSTIGFTGVSGSTDSYSINFASTSTGTTASPTAVNAGTVVVDGIETLNIDSGATSGVASNSITLTDSTLQTLNITGSQAMTVAFTGTNGTISGSTGGVSLIDGSTATGALNVTLASVTNATAGLTVKGGTAADTITTSTSATTLTGGAGADTFDVALTTAASATAPTITTITDASAGDIIQFTTGGTNVFNSTKVDVSTATALAGGTVDALDLAVTAAGNTNNQISWFQYGGDTYIVNHTGASSDLDTSDNVVKLTGLIDLSTATFAEGGAGDSTLTIA